ncbi:MAG: Hsp70 family protein [Candidatus Eremiobacteraeota bacterium]|nr:Hsp70 family protein [Candidatus Eremiobacteraeota bacterium]
MEASSRYSIGIDLGTTNSSVAYIDRNSRAKRRPIQFLEIPQVVAEGEVASRLLLPSFLYFPREFEVPREQLGLPWDSERDHVIGEFARARSALVAGRVVSSAKSWLCHAKVDRRAPLLPWGSPEGERTISPLDATRCFLCHLKEAWNHDMASHDDGARMEQQELVITVPASFDEAARELTVEAARTCGLSRIILLEEPQAAFYSWLYSHEASWRRSLKGLSVILVCDVGGGTSDFTLIRVEHGTDDLSLRRVAVGEHLLLGGDNMDLALARHMEKKVFHGERKLDSAGWSMLCQQCRSAKEKAFMENPPPEFSLTITGRGSRLVGGASSALITRDEVVSLLMEGFLPDVLYGEPVISSRGAGLKEWGLPYANDPAITRHLSEFLRHHLPGSEFPDAVLFNGGALSPVALQERIVNILEKWRGPGNPLRILPNRFPEHAVSRGAAYFGLVRTGEGVRIGGGTPRSYYVGVEVADRGRGLPPPGTQVLCLVPKDLLTEEVQEIRGHEFSLLLGRPVSFALFSSTRRDEDLPGELHLIDPDELEKLPPLYTVLSHEGTEGEVPVHLRAWITEIGTLELWCVSEAEQWKLQFALAAGPAAAAEKGEEPPSLAPSIARDAKELVAAAFQKKGSQEVKPRGLLSALEEMTHGKRELWPMAFSREIGDAALQVAGRRRSTPTAEASWFNVAGFALRPGFGYPLDEWRMEKVWSLFPHWLQHHRDPQCRLEWWIFWRRCAGGLDEKAQEQIFDRVSPYLFPGRKHIRTFPGPAPVRIEFLEMMRTASCIEKISGHGRSMLGDYVQAHLKSHPEAADWYWMIARIGSRIPFASGADKVLAPETVSPWVETLVSLPWQGSQGAFALSRIARLTGDRARDIDEPLRMAAVKRLRASGCDEELIAPLLEVVEDRTADQSMVFGESLPPGLTVKS